MVTLEIVDIPQKCKRVCFLISTGYSVEKACQETGISNKTFWHRKIEDKELDTEYVRAREARADTRLEALEDKLEKIEQGTLDAHAGRVIIDTIKWIMGKEKPKVYGDAMTLKGDKDNPLDLGLAAALERMDNRRLPAIDKPKDVIDLQPLPANAEDYI